MPWKRFPHHCLFVRWVHQSPVHSPRQRASNVVIQTFDDFCGIEGLKLLNRLLSACTQVCLCVQTAVVLKCTFKLHNSVMPSSDLHEFSCRYITYKYIFKQLVTVWCILWHLFGATGIITWRFIRGELDNRRIPEMRHLITLGASFKNTTTSLNDFKHNYRLLNGWIHPKVIIPFTCTPRSYLSILFTASPI